MWWRSIVLFGVVIVVGTLRPLAHASPVDPTYIPGLYDGADHDDAVLLVLATAGVLDGTPSVLWRVALRPGAAVVYHRSSAPTAPTGDAPLTRGLPTALLLSCRTISVFHRPRHPIGRRDGSLTPML
jgi:hypothetical protein